MGINGTSSSVEVEEELEVILWRLSVWLEGLVTVTRLDDWIYWHFGYSLLITVNTALLLPLLTPKCHV
jgi:hypothetical protein